MKYEVTLERQVHQGTVVEVEADNEALAGEEALEEIGWQNAEIYEDEEAPWVVIHVKALSEISEGKRE